MKTIFYNNLIQIKAYRAARDFQKELVYQNPILLEELIALASNHKDKNHHKALWIIELICEEKIALFEPYIEQFCNSLANYKGDGTYRPASKTCMLIVASKEVQLNENQQEQMINFCLERMLDSQKAATFSYSCHALFWLAKNQTWLYDEMKFILEKDLPKEATRGIIYTVKNMLKEIDKALKINKR